MSAPVRFLFVAVAGWTLFRGATLGILPGADAFTIARAEAASAPAVSAIVPTQFPPIVPVQPDPAAMAAGYASFGDYPPPPPVRPRYAAAPVYYYPAAAAAASRSVTVPLPESASPAPDQPPEFYAPVPQLEQWDLAQIARGSMSAPSRQSTPVPVGLPSFIRKSISTGCSLAPGRCGAAAGRHRLARQRWDARREPGRRPPDLRFRSPDRRLAAVEFGGRRKPGRRSRRRRSLHAVPVDPGSITAERRQAIGKFSTGRSAFALFAEGGVYQRPLGWGLCSTPMPKRASSASAAATCSPMAG